MSIRPLLAALPNVNARSLGREGFLMLCLVTQLLGFLAFLVKEA